MVNIVYVGTSLDGYIADSEGGLDFLGCVPVPEGDDLGFQAFMDSLDGLLMGRVTFETVIGFDCPWPYSKPVYVLSNTLTSVPEKAKGRAEIVSGPLQDILSSLNSNGISKLYVDGGQLVRSLLREDLVDDLILTRLPILLGSGVPLFGDLPGHLLFEHLGTEILHSQLVKSHYRRVRSQ